MDPLKEQDTSGFGDVPAAPLDAELDPNWSTIRGRSALPETYMPPAMVGDQRSWRRTVSWLLIAVFVGATAAGACLVYGPQHPFW